MAINYDSWKQTYSWLNDDQRKKYNDSMNAQGWDVAKMSNEYVQRFNEEQKNQQPLNAETSVSTPKNSWKIEWYGTNRDTNWFYTWNSEWEKAQNRELLKKTQWNVNEINQTPEEIQDSINKAQEDMKKWNLDLDTSKYNKDLDLSKFNEAPWEISVKEGTAQETGRPDYQASSQARLNEMKRNLDQYFQDSPWMFQDRDTFNKVFEYDSRDSEAQRQLLDSYWKRKQDMDKANGYTTWEAILSWMNNAEITTDQFNLLKEYNPDAYRKWQELQEDEVLKRIINDIVPKTVEEISWKINWMIEALWIQAQEALDVEWVYNETMERVGAYQTLRDAESTVKKLEDAINKKTSIMNRYANSTWGTVSDALAAARMNKAIAPYNELIQGLQYQYQDYANLYSQKTATALQAANVRVMQANENQRIWNQKCSALWFATSALSYRTPEEQAQLQLQTQQAQNEMQLLQQSKLNDLNLYNQYATAKLENQLQNELTDLSVTDEQQLRNNLNNVLSWYYSQWGAIIERPQSQVVDDVLAYAKANNVSVAEALRQNFIKPLQNKKEYKTKISQDYWLDKYQQQWSYTIDEEWNVVIKSSWYGEIPQSAFGTREDRQDAYENVFDYSGNWAEYIENLAWAIKDWSYGWQCGAFCNDVLIWWGESKVFWDTLEQKIKACNVDKSEWPEVWYAVVFDLWFTSSDWENHGHVGFVSAVNGDWSIEVLESNGKSDKTIHVKKYSKAEVDRLVMGYYKPNSYDIQKEWVWPSYTNNYTSSNDGEKFDPYSWVTKTTKKWAEVNAWGWITDLEDQYTKDRQNKDLMNQTLKDYGITIQEYNAQKKKYVDYQAKVTLIEDTKKMYDAVQDLLTWNQTKSSSGAWSRHSGSVDLATYNAIANGWDVKNILWLFPKYDKETANWINKYNFLKNNQLLDRYQELKKAWATFWAMQKSEWDLVGSAASKLEWLSTDKEFEDTLTEMLNHYNNILADAWVEWFYNTDIE